MADASFCSASCRKAWNNRRMVRGAELYDLVMACRFDRKTATTFKAWTLVCRLASLFRDEDRRERAGRAPAEILARRPYPRDRGGAFGGGGSGA